MCIYITASTYSSWPLHTPRKEAHTQLSTSDSVFHYYATGVIRYQINNLLNATIESTQCLPFRNMPPIQASYDHNELAWSAAPYRPRSRQRTTSLRGDVVRERPSSIGSNISLNEDGAPSLHSSATRSSFHGSQHLAHRMSDRLSEFFA